MLLRKIEIFTDESTGKPRYMGNALSTIKKLSSVASIVGTTLYEYMSAASTAGDLATRVNMELKVSVGFVAGFATLQLYNLVVRHWMMKDCNVRRKECEAKSEAQRKESEVQRKEYEDKLEALRKESEAQRKEYEDKLEAQHIRTEEKLEELRNKYDTERKELEAIHREERREWLDKK